MNKNSNKLLDIFGLVAVPVGVAILFLGIGNTSRGEETLGIALIGVGLGALLFAFRALRGSPTESSS